MERTWSAVAIAGKAADLYEPRGGKPRFGVVHLHGGDQQSLRDRPAFTRWFDEFGLACVCPHGRRCWWADRVCTEFDPALTPEQHVVGHVLPYCRERWGLAPRAVAIQGIGMGGQGALRIAFKRPDVFPVVGAAAPALDCHEMYGQGTPLDTMYDSKEQCRQDTALMHVPPTGYPPHIFFCIDPDDERWYRGGDRLHEKLTALGVPHEYDLTTRAGGHSWAYFNSMAERLERFVSAGLEQESRRLL
jgi:S-formylglutathione hydrolase